MKKIQIYSIPILATVGVILFAMMYEPPTPLWWVLATGSLFIAYSYIHFRYEK